jgi:hypothetical protein
MNLTILRLQLSQVALKTVPTSQKTIAFSLQRPKVYAV